MPIQPASSQLLSYLVALSNDNLANNQLGELGQQITVDELDIRERDAVESLLQLSEAPAPAARMGQELTRNELVTWMISGSCSPCRLFNISESLQKQVQLRTCIGSALLFQSMSKCVQNPHLNTAHTHAITLLGLKDPSQKNEALDQINQVCNAFAAHVSTHHIDLRMTNTSDQTLVQSAQYLQLPLAEQILWALINT